MIGEGRGPAQDGDRHHSDDLHRSQDDDDQNGDAEAQFLLDDEDFGTYEQYELDDVTSQPLLTSSGPRGKKVGSRQSSARAARLSTQARFIARLRGPQQPEPNVIRPFLPSVQKRPVRWLAKVLPHAWQKTVVLVLFLAAWAFSLAVPLVNSKGTLRDASGHVVRHLDCVDTLWRRNNECGLDGIDCQPFSNASFAFRCPADCAGVRVLNPRHVGPVDVNYRPLVIGGPVYRGDSFVCGSAIHAGVIDDASGGCGVATLTGAYYRYFASDQHGIESIGFDSHFPLSFSVAQDAVRVKCGSQKDPRQLLLAVSVSFTAALSLFTTSPSVLYFVSFVGIFAHVALVSDPPNFSGPSDTILPALVSQFVGRLLPALFCVAIMYYACARRALRDLPAGAQVEKTVLWVGGFWVGALSNHTFGWIPLSRLSAHDLAQQPGAKAALAAIVLVVALVVAQQAYSFWREARLFPHLALYGLFVAGLLACLALPGLELRIHHYILALILLPGTSMQTRPSLLYQGLLLGLFANGVARWGFDSLLQTAAALRGDALWESLVPEAVAPLIYADDSPQRISFKWLPVDTAASFDGLSVLVNDVERYRRFFAGEPLAEQIFTWTRDPAAVHTPEYFRFAYMRGGGALDYSQAGTWFVNATWSQGPGYYR
ncbi:hypothetical protein B0T26DRAFT_650673 [Lasiosphaeria miniovina]|uniref:LCCL domain-containing protein n=1 Tax=Lasiosphaeria miniovina TaxID=1954250 RepID=A0AA40ABT3_9PEZI|nr:uncharacterized protein B0T26DRAFT_650673 [Lasiosphaeria miniovina]KAK0713010.1 hypothetical protein B0T26DRAFT_650673 [Lasiosphaeria miniovina]